MVSEMQERQGQVVEAIKAERECSRQRAAELRDQERREKVEEQARRAEARLQASADRKRQPRIGRDEGVGRGGEFEMKWRRGKGVWVRTGKQPGRGLDWVRSKPERTLVVEARAWREGKEQMRKAVTGGLFQWEEGSLVGGDSGPDEGTEEGSPGAPQRVEESGGGRGVKMMVAWEVRVSEGAQAACLQGLRCGCMGRGATFKEKNSA